MTTIHADDVGSTFTRIESRDLAPIAVVAQCLDNQWVSQELLGKMLSNGWSFENAEVAKQRENDSRAEYLRAILNAEQVVVNRAFFVNNSVVHRDFDAPGPQREAFLRLVGTQVLIPYLVQETSPGERPRFTVDGTGWQAWRDVLQETNVHCLRLSWDDAENDRYVKQHMYDKFRRFLGSLRFLNIEGLRTDLGLDASAEPQLVSVLRDTVLWAMDEENPTREKFYERFVVADGSKPALGHFDRGKPFAGELKQLVDLRYNTNLPDVLGRYPLTPADSLHRTALQEERLPRLGEEPADPAMLAETLLRRRTFDLIQEPLSVSLSGLDLTHVWQARQTDAWHSYIRDLQALQRSPREFDTLAQGVYLSYVQLAARLSEVVGDRRRGAAPPWRPVIKVVIEVVGATLTLVYGAGDPVVDVVGRVAEEVAVRASTAVVRFVIGHHDRRTARNQLATGLEIMRLKLAHTRHDWEQLIQRFRESGLRVVERDESSDAEDDPGMDNPADSEGDGDGEG